MKKIKIIVIAISFLSFISLPASAQKGTLKLDLNYNYSIPVSGFKTDLISNTSPRGFRGGIMYAFSNKLEAGLSFGYQDYYQKYPRSIYALSKTQDVSAVLSNSIQTTPFLLKARYFPLNINTVKPYISVGAGTNLVDFKQYLGEFGSSQTSVQFLAQGGIGIMIPIGRLKTSGINVGAIYDYTPYKKFGYNNLNNVNLQAGIAFQLK
jgi:hypothetical protein